MNNRYKISIKGYFVGSTSEYNKPLFSVCIRCHDKSEINEMEEIHEKNSKIVNVYYATRYGAMLYTNNEAVYDDTGKFIEIDPDMHTNNLIENKGYSKEHIRDMKIYDNSIKNSIEMIQGLRYGDMIECDLYVAEIDSDGSKVSNEPMHWDLYDTGEYPLFLYPISIKRINDSRLNLNARKKNCFKNDNILNLDKYGFGNDLNNKYINTHPSIMNIIILVKRFIRYPKKKILTIFKKKNWIRYAMFVTGFISGLLSKEPIKDFIDLFSPF